MQLTHHAKHRAAQRCIPIAVIEAIFDFGTDYASRGFTGLRLDRYALELAADSLAPIEVQRLRRYFGAYVIASGDRVVTVAHSKRRNFH